MPRRRLVAATARHRQAADIGDGLDEGRLARAILPDEVCHRPPEGEVEVTDEGKTVGESLVSRHAVGDDVDALEERGGRGSHRPSLRPGMPAPAMIWNASSREKPCLMSAS